MDHGRPLDPRDEDEREDDEDDDEDALLELEPSDRGGVGSVAGAGAAEPGPCAW